MQGFGNKTQIDIFGVQIYLAVQANCVFEEKYVFLFLIKHSR
jgi:hypothetical protein